MLPQTVIDEARAELRRRLETPGIAMAGRVRARLLTRLEQLQKQHAWGDISDAEYQAQRDADPAALAELPDGDRITAVRRLPGAGSGPARRDRRGFTAPDERSCVGSWSSGSS